MGVGIYNRGSFQNHSNSSLHGQLTNGFQNGVSISRTYDALARLTGYRLIPDRLSIALLPFPVGGRMEKRIGWQIASEPQRTDNLPERRQLHEDGYN
jgi:hypothetical protein